MRNDGDGDASFASYALVVLLANAAAPTAVTAVSATTSHGSVTAKRRQCRGDRDG